MQRHSISLKRLAKSKSSLVFLTGIVLLMLSEPISPFNQTEDPALRKPERSGSTGATGRNDQRSPEKARLSAANGTGGRVVKGKENTRGREAGWRGKELLPPLPADPMLREEALARAKANALPPSPSASFHTTGGPGMSTGKTGRVESLWKVRRVKLSEGLKGRSHVHPAPPDEFGLKSTDLSSKLEMKEPGRAQVRDSELSPAARPLLLSFNSVEAQDFGYEKSSEPPDCDLAVGPDHVLTVTNTGYAIHDKCGNEIIKQRYNDLLNDSTSFYFDPKVIYDAWDDHWVMTVLVSYQNTQESYVVLLVSETGDPTGTWHYWYLDFTVDGSNPTTNWADYEDVSVDPYGIYITSNQFTWQNGFQYAKIRSLSKTEVYGYSSNLSWWDWWNLDDNGLYGFALRAAKMHTYSGTMYFISSMPGGWTTLSLWEQTGSPLSPTLTSYTINVAAYDNPPAAIQNDGTYLSAGDARLLSASYGSNQLWTTMCVRANWGEAIDRSAVKVYQVDTSNRSLYYESPSVGNPGLYYSYPAVDFDGLGRGIVVFSRGGPFEYFSTWYMDMSWGSNFSSSSRLSSGSANYDGFSSNGSQAHPFRWGDYFGCDTDPEDERTIWFYGEHAINTGSPNWGTAVGAVTYEQVGGINVSPTGTSVSTGPEGGPFTPPAITYSLYNPWMVTLNWTLNGVAAWNTPSATSGKLLPHTGTTVDVTINSQANSFGEGTYSDYYAFSTCYGATTGRATELTVGTLGSCPGAVVNLIPNEPVTATNPYGNKQVGAFITAIKNFEVCAVGLKADLVVPQTITAQIYSASGNTRGSLIAQGSINAITPGDTINYIPVSATLQACRDYDIAVTVGDINGHVYWLEVYMGSPYLDEPFDIGGVIRVRDGEVGGDATSVALPYISIIGTASCDSTTDLKPPPGTLLTFTSYTGGGNRGVYITPLKTIQLCSLGWKTDLVPGDKLEVKIYDGTGFARDSLIATGSIDVASSGEQFYDVPVDAVLEEGRLYDLAVFYGTTNGWFFYDENNLALPYEVGGVMRVEDGEYYGGTFTTVIPQLRIGWSEATGYAHLDLAKQTDVYPPPFSTGFSNSRYGMYITSLTDQAVYSIGWMADIPGGEPITINIYSANGTTRGGLLSSGTTVSGGSGMRWHDVPITEELASGADYDIEVVIPNMNEWRYWYDNSGMPYQPYGIIEVRDGENFGNASNLALIHLRINACNTTLTSVGEEELTGPPSFYLRAPSPNPASGIVSIGFSLDEPARMNLSIYDVKGRKVATVLEGSPQAQGPGFAEFDSGRLASGVYFIRLEVGKKSLARKMVVIH